MTDITEEDKVVLDQLVALLESTVAGQINWENVNPTTLVFSPEGEYGKVVLQQVRGKRMARTPNGERVVKMTTRYILQAMHPDSSEAVITINSSRSDAIEEALSDLFSKAKLDLNDKGVEYLKSLIQKAKSQS